MSGKKSVIEAIFEESKDVVSELSVMTSGMNEKMDITKKTLPQIIKEVKGFKGVFEEKLVRLKKTVVTSDNFRDIEKDAVAIKKMSGSIDAKRKDIAREFKAPLKEVDEVYKDLKSIFDETEAILNKNVEGHLKQIMDKREEIIVAMEIEMFKANNLSERYIARYENDPDFREKKGKFTELKTYWRTDFDLKGNALKFAIEERVAQLVKEQEAYEKAIEHITDIVNIKNDQLTFKLDLNGYLTRLEQDEDNNKILLDIEKQANYNLSQEQAHKEAIKAEVKVEVKEEVKAEIIEEAAIEVPKVEVVVEQQVEKKGVVVEEDISQMSEIVSDFIDRGLGIEIYANSTILKQILAILDKGQAEDKLEYEVKCGYEKGKDGKWQKVQM